MPDWTTNIIAKACNGHLTQDSDNQITGFSIDSRTLKQGNVFIAISGESFDGHKFIETAINNGASNIIYSSDSVKTLNKNVGFVKVDDCLIALQELAHFHRNRCKAKFIGVTGSNGKTTTKEMLLHLFSQKYKCSATKGNLNNHIGVPLTLLEVDQSVEIAIIEMGMNHPGEIRKLCSIANPDCSLITNIGPAHIGILGSLKNIALAKAEIVENIAEDSFSIIPSDSQFIDLISSTAKCKIQTFGIKEDSKYKITSTRTKLDSVEFDFNFEDENYNAKLNLPGEHNAYNATAALAMYSEMGNKLSEGIKFLNTFTVANSRMEIQHIENFKLIIDCYNANPASTKAAIEFLKLCPEPSVAILGDMKELGPLSEKLHREVGTLVARLNFSTLITVGSEAEFISDEAIKNGMKKECVFQLKSNAEAAELLRVRLVGKETILFKASRGMHFEEIIRSLWPNMANNLH